MEVIEIEIGIQRIKVVIAGFPHLGGGDLKGVVCFSIFGR